MTELAERLCLDLTDTLTGDVKFFADFLERSGAAVIEAEAELENVLLSYSCRSRRPLK